MIDIPRLQGAIREERLDGWLFYGFRHRDPLSDTLLGVPTSATNTRGWYYYLPGESTPLKIVHAIELGILDHLPGEVLSYNSRQGLFDQLARLKGLEIAVQFSESLNILSFLDFGTAKNLEALGARLVSSASLIQRVGLLTKEELESHEEAANHLYDIVELIWNRFREIFGSREITEGEVQSWILRELENRNLVTDQPPIVACGVNSGDPHYSVIEGGDTIGAACVIQFDLWAKKPGGIYADISWIGYSGADVPGEIQNTFSTVCEARNRAFSYIEAAFVEGREVSGSEVDDATRRFLTESGFAEALRHRTGHGIDRECHGSGVNLDSVEFPDPRPILEGSCFSIEPGVYHSEYGIRSEIDVYIRNGAAHVSGRKAQTAILTLS